MPDQLPSDPGYRGLTHVAETLPSHWYLDEAHYQRELSEIWYRQWLYVDRSSALQTAVDDIARQ